MIGGRVNLGYACINLGLSELPKSKRITTNRSMIRRTFDQRGLPYASKLSLQNCQDLSRILKWNKKNGFSFFRLSSNLFPWASEYRLEELPDYHRIKQTLAFGGQIAKIHKMRITSHPGPFNKLCSSDERILLNTIKELEHHGEVFDLLGLPRSPFAKINIHVGATYGNKAKTAETFCRNFERLSDAVKTRLTVENDDKASMYSTKDLYEMVYKRIGIPIVHDVHHHLFCTGGLSQEEAMNLAYTTWGGVKPVIHYSQSRAEEHNSPKIKPQAHSDSYWEPVETFGLDVDVMCECKHKEIGVFKLRELMRR